MQGPSAAVNLPQPDILSSPPLAHREALRRAGIAQNVRREIQRVQPFIGLRWCVFFMRSPGTKLFENGILLARCGVSPVPNALNSCRGILVPAARHFIAGRIGVLSGLISLARVVRFHVLLPFQLDTEGTSLCGRVSKTSPARGSTESPCHQLSRDGVRSVSVSIAGCEPAGAGANPVELPIFILWAARLVSKSAGLHPAVRGAKPRRSTIIFPV